LARELEAQIASVHREEGSPPITEPPAAAEPACGSRIGNPEAPARSSETPVVGASALSLTLPPQFTRFFGRQSEIERLEALRRDHSTSLRLVTMTGPGGSGKTRLAQEAAARLRERSGSRIGFVPLVNLTDPGLIAGQVLDALRVSR